MKGVRWPEVFSGLILPGDFHGREITIDWCPDCGEHLAVVDVKTGKPNRVLTKAMHEEQPELMLAVLEILLAQDPEKVEMLKQKAQDVEASLKMMPVAFGSISGGPEYTFSPN